MVGRQEQDKEKTTCNNYPAHLVAQNRSETYKNQDCYIRVFTLHLSIAETDVRGPRKGSFRVELVSQFIFLI